MNKIGILPEGLRNKIAAGEIVERPVSVLCDEHLGLAAVLIGESMDDPFG